MWSVDLENGKTKYVERYETPTGQTKYVSITLASKSRQAWNQAQKTLSQKIADKLAQAPSPDNPITFREVAQEWLDVKRKASESDNLKPSTITAYEARTRKVNEHIGDKSTDLIDRVYDHFSEKMDHDLKSAISNIQF